MIAQIINKRIMPKNRSLYHFDGASCGYDRRFNLTSRCFDLIIVIDTAEDDFTELSIPANKLGDLLNAEYAKVPLWCPFGPDLHLLIDRVAEDTVTHEKAETILHSGV